LVQLLDRFHEHYLHAIERLVPDRLIDTTLLSMLPHQHHNETLAAILRLVTDIHIDILQSFRRNILQRDVDGCPDALALEPSAVPDPFGSTSVLDPHVAFFAYLHEVAPDGALAGVPSSSGFADGDMGSFIAGTGSFRFTPDPDLPPMPDLGAPDFHSSGNFQGLQGPSDSTDATQGFRHGASSEFEMRIHHGEQSSEEGTAEDAWLMVDKTRK
jgi:hypothetical protein